MNASFRIGKVRVLVGDRDVEKEAELITLSGGFLGVKDDFTRPATDEDRVLYKEEYAAFKAGLAAPAAAESPPSSDVINPAPKVG